MGETNIVVLRDKQAVAAEAARRLVDALAAALAQRAEAHVALTGGSSAVALYTELAQPGWRTAIDWSRVHLWWGDDRFVPVDHPDSNIGMTYELLLSTTGADDGLAVPAENIHPYEIDEALSESDAAGLVAQRYAETLDELLPKGTGGRPAFDVILLGVGGDGHLMSIFPDSQAFDVDEPLVLAVPAPQHIGPHLPRVTLHPRLFNSAGLLLVMVSGPEKADVLADILDGERDPRRLPAQLAVRDNAVWLLDAAVAARLRQPTSTT